MDEDTQLVPAKDTRLTSINIKEEMENSYIDYSMSVIVSRALPDARDGFKPVHRRVLYSMYETKNFHNAPYKKSARIVGDVMGKYHPHGDSSIYDTLVRMAQWFSLRVPLVDGHGNFGTIDGDSAAAMRYTESRLAKVANEMLADIDKETVDFIPNYDGTEEEPRVLPSKLPNLLLNGSQGIAVGMATNIPPHNLRELCDGLIYFIDNRRTVITEADEKAFIDELMQFVKGPDFPTGAKICGLGGIADMYKNGRGSIIVRGDAEIVQEGRHETILITSIPYMVNKASMVAKIANLVKDGVIDGISDIRDETSLKEGIRVVIELKQNAKSAQVILNQLYKHSDLQTTFGANMIALDQGRPCRMSLYKFFQCYVDHRYIVHERRARFELNKALARLHIVDGLLIAQDNLDEVIHIIRDSKTNDEAKSRLIERFGFSDAQVTAILEMRLRQLTGLERDKLLEEQAALNARIAELRGILEDPEKVFALVKEDLIYLRETYTKENDRLTKIEPMAGSIEWESMIADEPCVITLSHRGYIKRSGLSDYTAQKRGGKGKRGVKVKEEDAIERIYVPMTHDTLLFFTNTGRVFASKAYAIDETGRTATGTPIVNLLESFDAKVERIVDIVPIRGFDTDDDICFVLADGTIKRTALTAYRNINRRGIIAITVEEGNEIIKVAITKPGDTVVMATRGGMINMFKIDEVRRSGRSSMGVKGMSFKYDGDRVCGFTVCEPGTVLLCMTENGKGKRSEFEDFRMTHRGSKGVIGNPSHGEPLIGVAAVKGDETMILLADNGMTIRTSVNQVRVMGRTAVGVNFMSLPSDVTLVGFSLAPAVVEENDDEETAEGAESSDTPTEAIADAAEATEATPDDETPATEAPATETPASEEPQA